MPQPRFFVELGGLMKYICNLITRDAAALQACKAGLPTTLRAPVGVLSPMSSTDLGNAGRPVGGGQLGSGGADTARSKQSGKPEGTDVPTPPRLMTDAI